MKSDNVKRIEQLGQAGDVLSQDRQLILGMPHLADRGLNENWLYRDCGHVHWGLINELLGCQSGQISDAFGSRLYASFVSTKVSGSLGPFRENERIQIESILHPLSSKRFLSHHQIRGDRGLIELSMVSTFIKQKVNADNRSFESTQPQVNLLDFSGGKKYCSLLDNHRQSRQYLDKDPTEQRVFSFPVVPAVDFNGAQFLYFANFHAIDDRAYHFFSNQSRFYTIDRVVHFFGNLNRGDVVDVFLVHLEMQLKMAETVTVLKRKSDSHPLAVIVTRRFVG